MFKHSDPLWKYKWQLIWTKSETKFVPRNQTWFIPCIGKQRCWQAQEEAPKPRRHLWFNFHNLPKSETYSVYSMYNVEIVGPYSLLPRVGCQKTSRVYWLCLSNNTHTAIEQVQYGESSMFNFQSLSHIWKISLKEKLDFAYSNICKFIHPQSTWQNDDEYGTELYKSYFSV